MASKHTPGPYLTDGPLVYSLEEAYGSHHVEKRNRFWARVYPGPDTPDEEVLAVARLFRVAPEMYDALREALSTDCANVTEIDTLERRIAALLARIDGGE